MCLSKVTGCTTQRVKLNDNYGLQLIIMYLYFFINYKKPHQCKMLITGGIVSMCICGGGVCVRRQRNLVLSAKFFCKSITNY